MKSSPQTVTEIAKRTALGFLVDLGVNTTPIRKA